MKKQISLAMTLLLALSVSACGANGSVPSDNQDKIQQEQSNTQQTPQPQVKQELTAKDVGREETKIVKISVEGESEDVPSTLHIGDGYSIYIPTEGWKYEMEMDDGILTESWESLYNEDVEFEILHMGEKSVEDAKKWTILDEDDYNFVELDQSDGTLIGTDPKDNDVLQVYFFTVGNNLYEIQLKYPLEATEGFASRMNAILGTFEPIK